MKQSAWVIGMLACFLCGCTGQGATTPTGTATVAVPTEAIAQPTPAATATDAPHRPAQTIPAPPTLPATGPTATTAPLVSLQLHSSAFIEQGDIPQRHSCAGENLSPALVWDGAPPNTRSWALVMDDPDAVAVAGHVWDHWLLYNLPAGARALPEGVAAGGTLADGSLQGKNSAGRLAYDGPCPPEGSPHHYSWRLYALDQPLDLMPGATKDELMNAMSGHLLAQAELVGLFQR